MLYILWRHLQYYLVHCKPVDPDISLGVPGIDRAGPRRLQGELLWDFSCYLACTISVISFEVECVLKSLHNFIILHPAHAFTHSVLATP